MSATGNAAGTRPPGPEPLRLVLARHGQTPANVDRVLDTRLPGPGLTDLGREQARALGRELAIEGGVRALYHSAARRAEETALLVGAEVGLTPHEVDGAYEVQAGDLEGRNDDAAVDVFRGVVDDWLAGDLDRALPGGESARAVLERFAVALDAVLALHPDGGTVVLVSHGAALRLVAPVLVAGPGVPVAGEDHLGNCGHIVVIREPAVDAGPDVGWALERWRSEVPGGLSSHDVTG